MELHSATSQKTLFFLANKILKAISDKLVVQSILQSHILRQMSNCDQMATKLQHTGAFPWQSSRGHTAESAVETIIKTLSTVGINIKNACHNRTITQSTRGKHNDLTGAF
jgi:hypothetical protein